MLPKEQRLAVVTANKLNFMVALEWMVILLFFPAAIALLASAEKVFLSVAAAPESRGMNNESVVAVLCHFLI